MDNIQKIMGTATKEADGAVERMRDVSESTVEKARLAWNDLSAQSKEAFANGRKSTEEAWEDAQQLVQKHPGKAVGIALLVGAAIGALLTFRNQD